MIGQMVELNGYSQNGMSQYVFKSKCQLTSQPRVSTLDAFNRKFVSQIF